MCRRHTQLRAAAVQTCSLHQHPCAHICTSVEACAIVTVQRVLCICKFHVHRVNSNRFQLLENKSPIGFPPKKPSNLTHAQHHIESMQMNRCAGRPCCSLYQIEVLCHLHRGLEHLQILSAGGPRTSVPMMPRDTCTDLSGADHVPGKSLYLH